MFESRAYWPRENTLTLAAAVFLSLFFVVVVWFTGGDAKVLTVLFVATISIFAISNFEAAMAIVIISLFLDYYVSGLSSAVWVTVVLALAFLLKHSDLRRSDFTNPISVPILVYGICILPSFVNDIHPFISLFKLLNVVGFLIVMYSFVAGVRSRRTLTLLVAVYLAMVLLNSMDVFRLYLTGSDRPFGFAGIMFVDYSALAVCIAAALSITSRGAPRILFLLLATTVAIALILTGTRNTWVSSAATLSLLSLYITIHPDIVGLSRRRVFLLAFVGLIVIGGSAAYVVSRSPRIEKRATQLSDEKGTPIDQSGKVENSLVSRLLIWDTAMNAFRAHPIVGIGVYSFPYSSGQYYRIPKLLFKMYVEGLSPHQTQLAVLVETGIVGAFGYLFFMFAALRTGFGVIQRASDQEETKYALVAFTALVYCSISMLFTDAWLWGQGIVLLALVIGGMLANRNIITLSSARTV
jgi:O-antigen ligase